MTRAARRPPMRGRKLPGAAFGFEQRFSRRFQPENHGGVSAGNHAAQPGHLEKRGCREETHVPPRAAPSGCVARPCCHRGSRGLRHPGPDGAAIPPGAEYARDIPLRRPPRRREFRGKMHVVTSRSSRTLLFVMRGIKAMHAQRPLQGHDRPLHDREQYEGQHDRQRQPQREMDPERRLCRPFHPH